MPRPCPPPRPWPWFLFLVLGFVSSLARPALAEPAAAEAESAAEAPEPITVRGTPPPRSASEVTVDKRVLEAAPHRNGSELLLSVPGFFVSQHSGEGKAHQIFFRGFDAVHGQDVEFWVAGAPANDVSNIHGQGYADLHFVIPEVVEAISSSPGNYDPKQGDFAVAGSVRYQLGYAEPGVTAQAKFGSFGARRYFMAYHPEGTSRENFAAFEFASTDGFGPSRAADHGSAIAQAVFPLGGGFTTRAMASAYAGRFDSAGVLPLDDVESGKVDRFATYDPKQGGYSARSQVVLELAHEQLLDSGLGSAKWSLSPFVIVRSLELRSNFTGFLQSPEGDSIQQLNDATTLGATASYQRPLHLFSERDRIEAGIYARHDSIRQTQHRLSIQNDRVTDDASSPGVEANVHATDVAGYLDASVQPVRRLNVRAGLRAESLTYRTEDLGGSSAGQTRSSSGSQLAKRLTVDYGIVPGLNALASYGEGFRSPQARSLGEGEPTPFTEVVSLEAGLRYRLRGTLESALALYRTALSDDLVFDPTTARNEYVPATSRLGLSGNVVALPNDWFVSSLSFTYARARFEESSGEYQEGDLLPYVPQWVVRTDLGVSPKFGRALGREVSSHFGFATTYIGRRPLPYAEFGHDVFLVDASASVRVGPAKLGVEAFNLFGVDWYDGEFVYASKFSDTASLVPMRHVSVGAPRTLLLSLTLFV